MQISTDEELIQRHIDFHNRWHRQNLESNKQEAPDQLWWHFRMKIRNITKRYMGGTHPMGYHEISIHEAWEGFIEAAKVTPYDDPAADRLVMQIVIAKQLGVLKIPARKGEGFEEAMTSSGERMWAELPFFARDLREYWAESMASMERTERAYLAGVCGRLCASGVCETEVASCVLILFREALETSSHGSEDRVSEYIPAIWAWILNGSSEILNGSSEILKLCVREYSPPYSEEAADDWCAGGELLGDEKVLGFSMRRWRFWIERLRSYENEKSNEESLRDQCKRSANVMTNWEEIMGGHVVERRERTLRAHYFQEVQSDGVRIR